MSLAFGNEIQNLHTTKQSVEIAPSTYIYTHIHTYTRHTRLHTYMEVEVELISKEFIKPSSPTPDHHRHYKLSFLDQLSPKVYNPWLLFYSLNNDDHDHDYHAEFNNIITISNHLKKSLSQVLSLYYPLAGRVKDDLFVDCNDDGVPFFEARVKGKLSDVINNPNINELNKFLPFELDDVTELALGVQLNIFECGGIAIGVCNSHQLSDALSNITFIKTWVATARQEPDITRPEFVSAMLFPPKNLAGLINSKIGITRKNNTTKRFVFKASAIEALRAKYDENSLGENQRRSSRVEALSAFIWSRFVAATNGESGNDDKKIYAVLHTVNLRPKFDPPLSENHFGNFFRVSITVPSLKTCEESHGFVRQVREEIRKIDKEFVRKLQEGDEHSELLRDRAERAVRGEVVIFAFTSLCRFPVYEADFGWGKPTWVGSAALNFHNVTAFMDAKNGDGIEAYLNLKDEDMAKLEVDKEFQAFVSPIEKSIS